MMLPTTSALHIFSKLDLASDMALPINQDSRRGDIVLLSPFPTP